MVKWFFRLMENVLYMVLYFSKKGCSAVTSLTLQQKQNLFLVLYSTVFKMVLYRTNRTSPSTI